MIFSSISKKSASSPDSSSVVILLSSVISKSTTLVVFSFIDILLGLLNIGGVSSISI